MSDIILKNVSKSFGDDSVISGFSHVFPSGSVTCIEGPSGCGKTTLLNMIAGLLIPDSGTIEGVPQKIAYVFQENRLCDDFTAVSNLRLVCGRKLSKTAAAAHLQELGLADDLKKPVREFSGGMKRRVSLARAVCFDADCILLDEPFKGLDEAMKKQAMDYLLRHSAGQTVICITHDPADAGYLGGERIVLTKQ